MRRETWVLCHYLQSASGDTTRQGLRFGTFGHLFMFADLEAIDTC